jgi:hypothetical protein
MAGEYAFFQKLVANVQLTASAVADASGKHGRVRRCLNSHYYNVASDSANSFLVGSYGKNTEIRPPSDVDILFELPASVYARFAARTGNVQSQLLQEVRGVLAATFSTTNVRGDGQIVSVPFGTVAVEVLPAFEVPGLGYRHADSNAQGSWRYTNPKQEMLALRVSNATTGGKTSHLTKLTKAWKRTRNVDVKSLVLELAAQQFLEQWPNNRSSDGALTSYGLYDWMMRDFFAWFEDRWAEFWTIPGTSETVYTGSAWRAQAGFAKSAATTACEHHSAERPLSAEIEWKKIFGEYVA